MSVKLDNNTSLRIIRVIDDTWTVDLEIEVSDPAVLAVQLMRSEIGRKMAALLSEALKDVKPKLTDEELPMVVMEELKIKNDEYDRIAKELKDKGIDLVQLVKRVNLDEPRGTGTEAQEETTTEA